jgi:hypothetical protein
MNKLFNAILQGAGVALGSILITKGVEIMQDPVKKAKIKDKFKRIKATVTE